MEVKSFMYRKSLFGIYYKQGLLNFQKMDVHVTKILSGGPFAKRDTITFRRKAAANGLVWITMSVDVKGPRN